MQSAPGESPHAPNRAASARFVRELAFSSHEVQGPEAAKQCGARAVRGRGSLLNPAADAEACRGSGQPSRSPPGLAAAAAAGSTSRTQPRLCGERPQPRRRRDPPAAAPAPRAATSLGGWIGLRGSRRSPAWGSPLALARHPADLGMLKLFFFFLSPHFRSVTISASLLQKTPPPPRRAARAARQPAAMEQPEPAGAAAPPPALRSLLPPREFLCARKGQLLLAESVRAAAALRRGGTRRGRMAAPRPRAAGAEPRGGAGGRRACAPVPRPFPPESGRREWGGSARGGAALKTFPGAVRLSGGLAGGSAAGDSRASAGLEG